MIDETRPPRRSARFAARRRRRRSGHSRGKAEADRRHLGRPVLGRPVRQYRQHFDGGLQRLSEGVVFPNGYQGHNATETCPGHSTILTGSRPARTGIIANNWFNLGLPPRGQGRLLLGGPARARKQLQRRPVHRLLLPSAGAGARRPYEARRSAQPGRRRLRQGPGGDHDGRLPRPTSAGGGITTARPSSIRARRRLRARSPRPTRACGRRCPGPAPPATFPRSASRTAGRCRSTGGGKPVGAGRFAREADDKNLLPRLARFRPGDAGPRRGAPARDAARRGRRHRPAHPRPFRDRLCRPQLRHPGQRDVHPADGAGRGARRLLPQPGRDRDRLSGHAHRRSWRPRHSRAPSRARRRRREPGRSSAQRRQHGQVAGRAS